MSALSLVAGGPLTMSSREIADLTGKEHKHVMRDIKVMLEQIGLPPQGYAQTWTNPQNGQEYPEYRLPRDLTITLVTGYRADLRYKVVKRLDELEAAAQGDRVALDLNSPAHLRHALLVYTEKVIALEAKVEADAPKVAFAEAVGQAINSQTFEEVAKIIGTGRNRLFRWLREIHVIPDGSRLPYQRFVDAGYFKVVQRTYTDPRGEQHVTHTPLITGAGTVWLQRKWAGRDAA